MQVKKRKGSIEDFDEYKIQKVIIKASKTAKEEIDEANLTKLVKYVVSQVAKLEEPIEVKNIRKAVENALMKYNYFDTTRIYIEECNKREATYLKGLSIWEEMDIKLTGKRNDRQNANLDEEGFSGRMGEAMDVALKEKALNYMVSPKFAKLHREFKNYIHDCNRYAIGMSNCLSFPIDNITAKAATIRVPRALRVPGGISAFCQLILVYLQSQSMDQFGGVSLTHMDYSSIPFIRRTFWKAITNECEAYNKYIGKIERTSAKNPVLKEDADQVSINSEVYKILGEGKIYERALANTRRECLQACESLLHNANTLQSRSGNQLPFTSLNYGACTEPEAQMLTECLLDAWEDGIGEFGLTPIFPCGIFQLRDGINTKKGEPNYYLFRRALEVLPKRDYPNFANTDWEVDMSGFEKSQHIKYETLMNIRESDKDLFKEIINLPAKDLLDLGFRVVVDTDTPEIVMNQEPRPFEMMSTMGALEEHEHLYIKVNEKVYDISIKDFFDFAKTGVLKNARPAEVFFNKERTPFIEKESPREKSEIKVGSGVYSITYKPTDVTYLGSSNDVYKIWAEHKHSIKTTGGLDNGPGFEDNNVDNYEFKVLEYAEDYKEAEKSYIERDVNIDLKDASQPSYKSNSLPETDERPKFVNKRIPQDLIDLKDKDIKVYDINNNWVKVKHVFKNDKLNTPLMMAIHYEDVNGQDCRIYATEDHPFFNGKDFTRADHLKVGDNLYKADGEKLPITSITWVNSRIDSYDIGTESGTFVGSDIKMHNCRTYNGFDINFTEEYFKKVLKMSVENKINRPKEVESIKELMSETKDPKRIKVYQRQLDNLKHLTYLPLDQLWSGNQKDGRGNITPCTIVLPFYAMEAKKKADREGHPGYAKDYFLDLVEKAIGDAKDELIERYTWICAQPKEVSKFMYVWNHTMLGWDENEGIKSCLKHGTLAIGSLGLEEACQIVVGKGLYDEGGFEVAEAVEKLYNRKCAEYKEHYKLNFGNYKTPAENLCYTSFKAFKKKYKDVENVTYYIDENGERQEKLFFTNSMHTPVYKNVDILTKFENESKLTKYTNAGCITYGEITDDVKYNIDALEQIVLHGKKLGLPYIALNFAINECTNCGNTDIDNSDTTCKVCGCDSKYINWLRRITGYLVGSLLESFNLGKRDEESKRVKHTKDSNILKKLFNLK